jgi:hypothetical protein
MKRTLKAVLRHSVPCEGVIVSGRSIEREARPSLVRDIASSGQISRTAILRYVKRQYKVAATSWAFILVTFFGACDIGEAASAHDNLSVALRSFWEVSEERFGQSTHLYCVVLHVSGAYLFETEASNSRLMI